MGQVSMTTRDGLVAAIAGRYAWSGRLEKGRILDEFVAVTKMHRKHAQRLLRQGNPRQRSAPRPGRRIYDEAVREALILVWESSDRICGKRLKPLVPILIEAMERHGHLSPADGVRTRLLSMSAATIDRSLREVRERVGGRKRRRAVASASLRRSVPVRTFSDWNDPSRGSSKPTWSPTAVRGQPAALSKPWCSLTSPRDGPNACRFSFGNKLC